MYNFNFSIEFNEPKSIYVSTGRNQLQPLLQLQNRKPYPQSELEPGYLQIQDSPKPKIAQHLPRIILHRTAIKRCEAAVVKEGS